MKELLKDNDIVKALENQANGYGAGIVGDLSALTLDLIHRQKAEIERLKNLNNSISIGADLHAESYKQEIRDLESENAELQKQVEAWKAKARELEQSWEISSSNEVVLQKQVYELKNDLRKSVELIKEGGELAKMNNEIIAQVYEQTVKDTAKEILQMLEDDRNGYWDSCDCGKDETYWRDNSIQGTLNEIKERYGVEVE